MNSNVTIIRARTVMNFVSADLACGPKLSKASVPLQHRNGSTESYPKEIVTIVETLLARGLDPVKAGKLEIVKTAAEILGVGGQAKTQPETPAVDSETTEGDEAPEERDEAAEVSKPKGDDPAFDTKRPEYDTRFAGWTLLISAREILVADCSTGAGSRMRRLEGIIKELGPSA